VSMAPRAARGWILLSRYALSGAVAGAGRALSSASSHGRAMPIRRAISRRSPASSPSSPAIAHIAGTVRAEPRLPPG
jgi:hypothetical protein